MLVPGSASILCAVPELSCYVRHHPSPLLFPCGISAHFPLLFSSDIGYLQGPQKLLESQGRACFSLLWVSCAWQVQNRKTFLLFSQHCCWQILEGMKFGQWCLWTELWASFSVAVVVRKWHSWEAFPSNLKCSHSFCLQRDTARVSELTVYLAFTDLLTVCLFSDIFLHV